MLAAWGDSIEEEEGTEEEKATVALMARSDSESDEELDIEPLTTNAPFTRKLFQNRCSNKLRSLR